MSSLALDVATEFLFGNCVEGLSAGLPYPHNAAYFLPIKRTVKGDAETSFESRLAALSIRSFYVGYCFQLSRRDWTENVRHSTENDDSRFSASRMYPRPYEHNVPQLIIASPDLSSTFTSLFAVGEWRCFQPLRRDLNVELEPQHGNDESELGGMHPRFFL